MKIHSLDFGKIDGEQKKVSWHQEKRTKMLHSLKKVSSSLPLPPFLSFLSFLSLPPSGDPSAAHEKHAGTREVKNKSTFSHPDVHVGVCHRRDLRRLPPTTLRSSSWRVLLPVGRLKCPRWKPLPDFLGLRKISRAFLFSRTLRPLTRILLNWLERVDFGLAIGRTMDRALTWVKWKTAYTEGQQWFTEHKFY